MKKLIFLLIVTAAGALLLTACSPIWSYSDTEVAFDGNGHMTKDVTYIVRGSYTETFSADGTYEDIRTSWNAIDSAWEQSGGDKGTYSYNTGTRMMTITYTQIWNGGIGGSYVTLTSLSTSRKTYSYTEVFSSSNKYEALPGSGGNYIESQNRTYWNGTSNTYTWTIVIPSDFSTVTYTSESVSYDASGAPNGGSKSSDVYTVSAIFPSGVTSLDSAKGKTLTYNYLSYVDTPSTWTSGTDFTAGASTTYNNSESDTFSIASDGSYIVYPNMNVPKHLGIK